MRPDPTRPSSSFGSAGGMAARIARAIVLLVGLAGCGPRIGIGVTDLEAECLKELPGDVRCCYPGEHIDQDNCCPDGEHLVRDVEHADWAICLPDETPADAGADAP